MDKSGEGISENLKLISILIKETNIDYSFSLDRELIPFDTMRLKVKIDRYNLLTSMHRDSGSSLVVGKENQKDNIINTLRDTALLIESIDLEKAFILMDVAAINRPEGPFIQDKREEYFRKLNKNG